MLDGQEYLFYKDSLIIYELEIEMVNSWLPEDVEFNQNTRLLYKATVDGDGEKDFWAKCKD